MGREHGTCRHASTCSLYARFTVQGALRIWQLTYCEADYASCARYQRGLAGERIPDDLLPNGKLLTLAPPPGKERKP